MHLCVHRVVEDYPDLGLDDAIRYAQRRARRMAFRVTDPDSGFDLGNKDMEE